MTRALIIATLCAIFLLFSCNSSFSQEKEKISGRTYIKLDLFSIVGSLEGFPITTPGYGLELEHKFAKNKLFLSGWAIGYRKEDINDNTTGHYIEGKAFRYFGLKPIDIRVGGGVGWGLPSSVYENSKYEKIGDNYFPVTHTYLRRNTKFIAIKIDNTAVLYPFMDFAASWKPKFLVFEAGVRGNLLNFGVSKYEYSNGFFSDTRSTTKIIFIPYIGVGTRIRF
jgi:hypothetical protein